MSSAKAAVATVVAALSLSACGVASKPEAGSAQAAAKSQQQVTQEDPRTKHVQCLAQNHIGYREETIHGYPSIQVGSRPSGPLIEFTATPGAAQDIQIKGDQQGAEVIGSALVFPYQARDGLMSTVEKCMALGVKG